MACTISSLVPTSPCPIARPSLRNDAKHGIRRQGRPLVASGTAWGAAAHRRRLWRAPLPLATPGAARARPARAEATTGGAGVQTSLKDALANKDSEEVRAAMAALKDAGAAVLWASYPNISRRTTYMRELAGAGIKNPEALASPSVRNDLAFLVTVVGTTSVLAVLAGVFLPGDWGFFVPYLLGGVSLAVLAVGSTAPGLLEAGIGAFSQVFPDYKERILRHEAAHFLVAYLLGVPVVAYSLDTGREHTNLVDAKLQKRLYEGALAAGELDRLAVVAMAGLAAEGLKYDKVTGQSADLFSLQRLINRSTPKLGGEQQQSLTRWAVVYACSLLKTHEKAYAALMAAMDKGSSVEDCVVAIESGAEA